MSGGVRFALYGGLLLALIYFAIRMVRSKGNLQGRDLYEVVGLLLMPSLLPGAITMIIKALDSEDLPIFNSLEDRIALILGGAMLIAAFFYGLIAAMKRAWGPKRTATAE